MSAPGLFGRSIHGARWIGISKALSQAFMWVVTIYVVQLLQPADYGLVAMGGMLTILAGMLLDAGLGAAFVQRRDATIDVYRAANGALLLTALAAVATVQLLAAPAARFFAAPLLDPVLRVSSLQLLLGALTVVPGALLQGQMRFKQLAISQACAGAGSSAVTLACALLGAGVWSLVIGVIAQRLILAVFYFVYVGGFAGMSMQFGLLRSYLAFSANLVAQRLTWFWVEQIDQLVIGRLLGQAPLGAYSVARNLSHIPLDRTAEIVNQVSLPSFAAVQDDPQRWRDGLRKLMRLAAATSFPVFWGMGAVAPVALPLLLGPQWDAAVVPFMLFCAILPLRTAHSLTCTVLLGLGRADLSFRSVLIWAVLLTPLFFVGARFGLFGVALAWVVGFPLVYLVSVWMLVRVLRIPASLLFQPMASPALAAAACVAAVLVTQAVLVSRLSPLVVLGLQVAAGAITYIGILRLSSREVFAEVVDLVQRFSGRRTDPAG
jgi:teichuronic acid exporter